MKTAEKWIAKKTLQGYLIQDESGMPIVEDGYDVSPEHAKLIAAAPELLSSLKQALGYIEMTMAHNGAMSVEQIKKELEYVKKTSKVSTSHHLGCPVTTREFDLEKARKAIENATQ